MNETTDEEYVEDTTFFTVRGIPHVNASETTPFDFYRNFIAASRPCILHGCFDHWPANKIWNDKNDTIVQQVGADTVVTCNFTPAGLGDHIHEGVAFVKPEERELPFGEIWERLTKRTKENEGIPYVSFQNDSLRKQFPTLEHDIDVKGPRLTQDAFGPEAELTAVNLWVGDERSISSVHKDPYDNVYCVIRGIKTFTLLPPTDVKFLGERAFPSGSYHLHPNGTFDIVRDDPNMVVPWCEVDPAQPDLNKFPRFKHASPVHIEVKAGETLFLPALWYHRVGSKDGLTIAVNYWYEMTFGPVYTAYQLARRMSGLKLEHEYNVDDLTEKQKTWSISEGIPEEKTAVESQQEEEEDVCPVCIEALQKYPTKFVRYTCCGKGIHFWCDKGIIVSSLSQEQKNLCPLCRTEYAHSDEETVEQLCRWVEKGKAWAQSTLGQRYQDGIGVDQSDQQARELFELAASQGYANAQYNLGCIYDEGQGVDQSDERAREYYEAAARQGIGYAQTNLGLLFHNDQGVERSFETARKWYMKAAEQGVEQAIKNLQNLDKKEKRTTPSFTPKPFECATCYRPHDPTEHKLRPCNGCHRVYYCGRECQVEHWKREGEWGHKKNCNKKVKSK